MNALDNAQMIMGTFCSAVIHRLNEGLPPVLFHYTTANGMKGILKSGHFLVNDMTHLNDVAELRYAGAVMRAQIDRMRALELSEKVLPLFDALQARLNKTDFGDVYILSLVTNGDDRHLWNLYADRGKGVSLSIDLTDHLDWNEGWFLVKCHYGDDAVGEFCRNAVSMIRAIYADNLSNGSTASADDYADLFFSNVRWFAPIFKIKSWADEKEWRLFHIGVPPGGERVLRPDGRFCVKAPTQSKLKLVAAAIGPRSDPETALEIIREAHINGYGRIEIHHSQFSPASLREAIDARIANAKPDDGANGLA